MKYTIILLLFSYALWGQTIESYTDFKFNFETLTSKDTLLIMSEVRDCGEFGGHNEYIKIYFDGKNNAALKRDKLCDQIGGSGKSLRDPDKNYKTTIALTNELQQDVLNYITAFQNFKEDPDSRCNAPSSNYIEYRKNRISFYDERL